jgi:hypothetical protein
MMVVRKVNQIEYATTKVPVSVWVATPKHLDGMTEEADSVEKKIGSGRAFLKVVAYPWGVEFDVCDAGEET